MRMTSLAGKGLLTLALCALSGAAMAHVGHEGSHAGTFFSGLAHPVSGMDHLLAMVAVGLWSAVALPQRRWLAPAVFVATMTLGALLAYHGMALVFGSLLEWLIAASVVLMGVLLVSGAALPVVLGLGLVAASALFHGTAHGLEMTQDEPFLAYGAGFVVSTALLHFGGVGLGVVLQRAQAQLPRAAGALIGGAGLFMLLARI